jgi:hypothetical protein
MKIQDRSLPICFVAFAALLFTTVAGAQNQKPQDNAPRYRNPSLSIDDRVADLLSRMTLEEKVGQISGGGDDKVEVIDPTGTITTQQAREILGKWYDPDLSFPADLRACPRLGKPSKPDARHEDVCGRSGMEAILIPDRQLRNRRP